MNHLPIGILDSGRGGLTVMREVQELLPQENIFYFADTANFPYGEKSPEEIVRCTLKSASFLFEKKIKLLLLACHTASCHALTALTQLPIPVISMIEPSLCALRKSPARRIAILGTTSTIESGFYQTLLQKELPQAEILPIACPLFVPSIEREEIDSLEPIARHCLAPLLDDISTTVFLACTHFPLMRPLLQKILPTHCIVDPAKECAQLVFNALSSLQNPQTTPPTYTFFNSSFE